MTKVEINMLYLNAWVYLARYDASKITGHDLDLLGSGNVIGHVTIRLAVGDFLLEVRSDNASVSWPFEVLTGRLFQERKSVAMIDDGRRDRATILHWSHILLFATL